MEHPQEPESTEAESLVSRRPKQPLYIRMFFQRHMIELVRAFGYASIPLEEARERIKPLVEKYGQSAIESATKEILIADYSTSASVVRLSDEARKLAVQILGRPKEAIEQSGTEADITPTAETDPPPKPVANPQTDDESVSRGTRDAGKKRKPRKRRTANDS